MTNPHNDPAQASGYAPYPPLIRVEIDVSWRDVDALNLAQDLVKDGDMWAGIIAAQTKQPQPKPNVACREQLLRLVERIVQKLPPRGTGHG